MMQSPRGDPGPRISTATPPGALNPFEHKPPPRPPAMQRREPVRNREYSPRFSARREPSRHFGLVAFSDQSSATPGRHAAKAYRRGLALASGQQRRRPKERAPREAQQLSQETLATRLALPGVGNQPVIGRRNRLGEPIVKQTGGQQQQPQRRQVRFQSCRQL